MSVYVRVDKINKISSRGHDTLLGWFDWTVVPDVGELLNIDGEPYHVIERGWAAGAGTKKPPNETVPDYTLYCYLRIR